MLLCVAQQKTNQNIPRNMRFNFIVLMLMMCYVQIVAQPTVKDLPTEVPIYENFSDIEHIFQYKNDTTYVINFWATWCKPCVEELPYFETLHNIHAEDKVKIILVSLDFPNQIESKLYPFIEKHNLKSEVIVLLDGKYNDWIEKVDEKWSGAIPITVVYKGDNRVFVEDQFHSVNELEALLTKVK